MDVLAGWTQMVQQKIQILHLMDVAEVRSKDNSVTFLYTVEELLICFITVKCTVGVNSFHI